MKKAIFCGLILVLLYSCNQTESGPFLPTDAASDGILNERWEVILSALDSVQEGDLVARCGNDMTSYSLRDFSQKEKLYSHSGIVVKMDSGLYVFHNMAGDLNPDEIMRYDRLDSFFTPATNIAFGIYRYNLTQQEKEKLRAIVLDHYKNKLPFDMNFDLETDDKMYCVEMIAKSVNRATDGRIRFKNSLVNHELRQKYLKLALQKKVLPSSKAADQREYLAIDDLYFNPDCRMVFKKIFEDIQKPVRFPSPENDSL